MGGGGASQINKFVSQITIRGGGVKKKMNTPIICVIHWHLFQILVLGQKWAKND